MAKAISLKERPCRWYNLERAKAEGRNSVNRKEFKEQWKQKVIEGLKLARLTGLKDQEQQIQADLLGLDREFRRLIAETRL